MSIKITQFEEATSLILKFLCGGNRANNAIKDFLSDGEHATRYFYLLLFFFFIK